MRSRFAGTMRSRFPDLVDQPRRPTVREYNQMAAANAGRPPYIDGQRTLFQILDVMEAAHPGILRQYLAARA